MKNKILILFAAIVIVQLYLISALAIKSTSSDPDEIQPGEKFSLNLKIENDLGKDVTEVVIKLGLNEKIPFAPYQSSSEYNIGEINKDDNENANFDLIAFSDATSGTYMIPVTVSYNNGIPVEDEPLGLVSIIINAKPKIAISSENSILIKGSNGKISLKVVNLGLGGCKFLNINAKEVSGVKITSPEGIYIGNIESNDFDTADFDVFISANAPSLINLPVEIKYTDSRNNEIIENKIISVETYTQSDAISLGLIKTNKTIWIIFSVVFAIFAYVIYRKIRKRVRSKKNSK